MYCPPFCYNFLPLVATAIVLSILGGREGDERLDQLLLAAEKQEDDETAYMTGSMAGYPQKMMKSPLGPDGVA